MIRWEPVERCLACEAVASMGHSAAVPYFVQRSMPRFLALHTQPRAQPIEAPGTIIGPAHHGLASEARSTGGDPTASQARQRSTGSGPAPITGNIEVLRHLKLIDSHAYH
jgi:hypothetical protein